jgi:glyoxylase I family protein
VERPFTLDHLDHIVLRVRDLKRTLAFYDLLGVYAPREVSAGTAVRVADNQQMIFQERKDFVPAEVGAIDHINLTIKASSIYEVADYLRENGAEITRGPEEAGAGPTVYVSDPDGYVLEIRIARER